MKTQITLIGIMLLLFSILVGAQHTENDSADARQLIEQKVPCSQLSEEQLEHIGDYIMEQMHPGEAHKVMDQMMGGEGSESLRAAHINMARHFYCRKGVVTDMGMMNTGGMMNMGMMNAGMMGGAGWGWMSLIWLVYVAVAAFIFGVIFWWTYKLIVKKIKRR